MTLRNTVLPTLTLFGSLSSLLCCALPAFLVSIGAGAVMIGLIRAVPQLVWVSEHKVPIFIFAGVMLALSAVARYLSRNAPCPADPAQARACVRVRRLSLGVFSLSLIAYLAGFYFAFIA
jgi:hypothetical protein